MINDELGDDDIVRAGVVATERRRRDLPYHARRRGARSTSTSTVSSTWWSSRCSAAASIVGTLAAHNRLGDVSSFDDEDVKVFATLAHHLGTAIENARLIERLRTEVSQKEYQSLHDTLTGLANRDLFVARTERRAAREPRGRVERRA